MDIAVILQIIMLIIETISDKSADERLAIAADLQAVSIESSDPADRLIARAAMCAVNCDDVGAKKIMARVEQYQGIVERAATRAKGA